MLQKHRNIGYVLPDKQVLVLANRIFYEIFPETGLARASVLMNDPACRRQQAFPAAFPSLIRQVGVFDIEGVVQGIKPPNREKLIPVDSARAASCPDDWDGFRSFVRGLNLGVPEVKEPAIEARSSHSGLFPATALIGEKDLRSYCEDGVIRKGIQKRTNESAVYDHVVVEKNDDAGSNIRNPAIVALRKPVITIERQYTHTGKILADELDTSIGAAIVDDKYVVVASVVFDSL
jgi:hypothetical protein